MTSLRQAVFALFLFYHLVFFCSMVLSFFLTLLSICPSIHGYLSSFYIAWFYEISSFCPWGFTNFFWFLVGISLGLPTNLLIAWPLPPLKVYLLHHSPSLDKIPCFVSLFSQYLPSSIDKDWRLSLYLYLWHTSSGPFPLLASFGWNVIPVKHFSKRSFSRNPNIDPIFSPPPNHTL